MIFLTLPFPSIYPAISLSPVQSFFFPSIPSSLTSSSFFYSSLSTYLYFLFSLLSPSFPLLYNFFLFTFPFPVLPMVPLNFILVYFSPTMRLVHPSFPGPQMNLFLFLTLSKLFILTSYPSYPSSYPHFFLSLSLFFYFFSMYLFIFLCLFHARTGTFVHSHMKPH